MQLLRYRLIITRDRLRRTIGALTAHAPVGSVLHNALVSKRDRSDSWHDQVVTGFVTILGQITDEYGRMDDVDETAARLKAFSSGLKMLVMCLTNPLAEARTRARVADVILQAWEFVVDSNYRITERYTRPPYVGAAREENLYRTIVQQEEQQTIMAINELPKLLSSINKTIQRNRVHQILARVVAQQYATRSLAQTLATVYCKSIDLFLCQY